MYTELVPRKRSRPALLRINKLWFLHKSEVKLLHVLKRPNELQISFIFFLNHTNGSEIKSLYLNMKLFTYNEHES